MENQPMGQTLCLDCSGTGKKNDETPCPGCEGPPEMLFEEEQ